MHAIHEAKLVHGHIHPENVYVDENGKGVLAEYDFSKSLVSRECLYINTIHIIYKPQKD